jgi:hypothetical protein
MRTKSLLSLTFAALLTATAAGAATTIPLPDESQTTTLDADVTEQAQVTVPATITFNVTDIALDTSSAAASPVTITNIVLDTATKQLKLSVKGSGASFSGSATPYNAADVRWTGGSWTNGTGAASGAGGLTTSYKEVATCDADVASCSTTDAVFTLKSNTSITQSGNQSLTMTWKFESIGT